MPKNSKNDHVSICPGMPLKISLKKYILISISVSIWHLITLLQKLFLSLDLLQIIQILYTIVRYVVINVIFIVKYRFIFTRENVEYNIAFVLDLRVTDVTYFVVVFSFAQVQIRSIYKIWRDQIVYFQDLFYSVSIYFLGIVRNNLNRETVWTSKASAPNPICP